MLIERLGDLSCTEFGRKQTILMDQHDSDPTFSLRIGERRCSLTTSIHALFLAVGLNLSRYRRDSDCGPMSGFDAEKAALLP